MKKVELALGTRSYQIHIGINNLSRLGPEMRKLGLRGKVLIVTNTKVEPLYAESLIDTLKETGFSVHKAVLPDGENYKNLDNVAFIYDCAFNAGLDRQSSIIARAEGSWRYGRFCCRNLYAGINFIQVPTTLLAQVDASIGGKVAVNHPQGKNMIGAFYQPRMVFMDIATLLTLSSGEIRSGFAEIIKYGVISNHSLYSYLEEHPFLENIDNLEYWMDVVEKSCLIKAQVVSKDEREQGLRAILNFGHTIGHGLEAATSYQKYSHGRR